MCVSTLGSKWSPGLGRVFGGEALGAKVPTLGVAQGPATQNLPEALCPWAEGQKESEPQWQAGPSCTLIARACAHTCCTGLLGVLEVRVTRATLAVAAQL